MSRPPCDTMEQIYHLIYVCCPPSARRLEISSPLRLKSGTTCNFALQKKCLQPTGLPACNLYHLRRQFASPGPQVIARQRKRVSQEGLLGARVNRVRDKVRGVTLMKHCRQIGPRPPRSRTTGRLKWPLPFIDPGFVAPTQP